MNLLEQYIVEVHGIEPHTEDWTKKFPNKEFIEVDVTTNCYGSKRREKHIFDKEEWGKYKEQGYWMA